MVGSAAQLMVELRLQCPQDQVEQISDALMALDALSVSVEDADAHTDQEQALFGEPGMPPPGKPPTFEPDDELKRAIMRR